MPKRGSEAGRSAPGEARRFDVIVVGSGSGLEVSAEAAQRGLSVAVIEPGPFGGTCLNRGCIPSKLLIHCADVMETVRNADKFGIRVRVEGVDWAHIMERASHTVDEEARQIEEGNRATENIEVYKSTARFVGMKVLEVAGERITAPTIVIAAGTRPTLLNFPGVEEIAPVTSDEALRLPAQPRSMAIVGGGFIAAEMAHFFGALGTEVTIIHRRDTMLRDEDEDVARRFTDIARRKFNFLGPARIQSAVRARAGVELQVEVGDAVRTVEVDTVFFATGRRPKKLDYVTATYEYRNTAYGESIGDEDGFVKVIAGRAEGEILGCHVIGAEASILVQEAVNAMRGRLGIDAINQSIYIHPALPEVMQRAFGALEI